MKPRYIMLFLSEDRFIPAIDVERGPINGAAQERQHGSTPGRGKHHQMPSPMPAAAPPEPTPIDWDSVCLLDEHPDLWRRLLEHRGGCRCHIAPPCSGCSDPLSEKEIAMLEHWRAEPTPADSPAWVPWHGGECPVPEDTPVITMLRGGIAFPQYAPAYPARRIHWSQQDSLGDVVCYRLANPTPRGPCTLPPDHPHAELERLWRSDASLRRWWRCGKRWFECDLDDAAFHVENVYHVGHVAPQEGA